MTSLPVAEQGVLTVVPDELKSLAKYIMHGFYSVEHALVVDLLIRNTIMKEDDLADLLKFDKKQLRTLLMKIKNDKLLKQVMRVETQADGRAMRHYYYYINYKTFVNVVRFKLDRMRQKIENRERDSTCKALFKCTGKECDRTYNEFDAGNLYDPFTMQMKCTYCGSEVLEDESAVPKRDAVTQMVTFNEQMKPIFDLLKDVEHVKLSQDILDPTPVPLSEAQKGRVGDRGLNIGGPQHGWRENNRNPAELYHQDVTINIGENKGPANNEPAPRERPVWMTESTVDGAIIEAASGSAVETMKVDQNRTNAGKSHDGEIMKALLAHERKVGQRPSFHHEPNSDNESDASASDDEFPQGRTDPLLSEDRLAFGTMMGEMSMGRHEEEEEEEDEDMMVMVQGRQVPLDEVTPEMISEMDQEEKDEYIRLAQQAHADMYE
ncbi:general transcription factor IIE subunit 1-like [Lytechinus variegatus]|uniref:general transcription factor IIE subunit 1-like n=1 Tax=Lytechinus variegatus TaxID=7654 RepID=UPI001BB0F22B|nr:general transcription factor IIE subunit 1-like [Lytechinus variegatus]